MARPIPITRGLPILGNILDVRKSFLDLMERMAGEGDVVGFRFGPKTIYVINNAELISEVLVEKADCFHKSYTERMAAPFVGEGLLLSEDAKHRRQRRMMAPAFQHRNIGLYARTMVDYTGDMIDRWQSGGTINTLDEMTALTLRIVGRTLFDASLEGDTAELGTALDAIFRGMIDMLNQPFPLPLSVPTPLNRRIKRNIATLDRVVYRMVADRRASAAEHNDLLSMLLAARDEDDGTGMTDQQIRDEAATLVIAGHETTAVALTWALGFLASHPAVLATLHEELDSVLAGAPPAMADYTRLSYTTKVIKETLRLRPPLFAFGREAVTTVGIGDYQFKPGDTIDFVPYTLHRDPAFFPDPLRFDPDRWTPEMEKGLPRHQYLPFGGGPRICIGNQFAMLEATMVLATILQRFTVESTGPLPELEPLLSLRPRTPLMLRISHRVPSAPAVAA